MNVAYIDLFLDFLDFENLLSLLFLFLYPINLHVGFILLCSHKPSFISRSDISNLLTSSIRKSFRYNSNSFNLLVIYPFMPLP